MDCCTRTTAKANVGVGQRPSSSSSSVRKKLVSAELWNGTESRLSELELEHVLRQGWWTNAKVQLIGSAKRLLCDQIRGSVPTEFSWQYHIHDWIWMKGSESNQTGKFRSVPGSYLDPICEVERGEALERPQVVKSGNSDGWLGGYLKRGATNKKENYQSFFLMSNEDSIELWPQRHP